MKKTHLIIGLITLLTSIQLIAQHNNSELPTSINQDGAAPDASAILDVQASDKGVLIPRMDKATRDLISNPATGLLIFQTDNDAGFYYYNGTNWKTIDDKAQFNSEVAQVTADVALIIAEAAEDDIDAHVTADGDLDATNELELPTVDGTSGQFLQTNGAGTVSWATPTTAAPSSLNDGDSDTQIQVEKGSDDDIIRFDVEGTEFLTLYKSNNGRLMFNVKNNGNNVFFGNTAGNRNTSGTHNVFLGNDAGFYNDTGNSNVGLGTGANFFNAGGNSNVVLGYIAGYNSTSGNSNVFIGRASGNDNTGNENVFVGRSSAFDNANGVGNTMIGTYAGGISVGSGNVFLGYYAGYSELGSNKLYIENSSDPSPLIYGEFDNNIVQINGTLSIATTFGPNEALQLGESGDGTKAVANAWDTFSDARWKTNIQKVEKPMDKIAAINGYYYKWKEGKDQTTQFGVMAQEIEAVLPEIVSTNKEGYKSVDYSKLTPLLVEGIKAQQAEIEKLQSQNQTLQAELDEQSNSFEQRLQQLEAKLIKK